MVEASVGETEAADPVTLRLRKCDAGLAGSALPLLSEAKLDVDLDLGAEPRPFTEAKPSPQDNVTGF